MDVKGKKMSHGWEPLTDLVTNSLLSVHWIFRRGGGGKDKFVNSYKRYFQQLQVLNIA